jgi:hypothetical protein
MVKASLVLMVALTVLISIGLRWREERTAALRPAKGPRPGFVAQQKLKLKRWINAAALAALVTLVVLGGLHWLRVWQG